MFCIICIEHFKNKYIGARSNINKVRRKIRNKLNIPVKCIFTHNSGNVQLFWLVSIILPFTKTRDGVGIFLIKRFVVVELEPLQAIDIIRSKK